MSQKRAAAGVTLPTGLTPSMTVAALEKLIPGNTPVFLWGPPGTGKSSYVRQSAKRLGMSVVDVRAATTDPVDWRGVPAVVDGQTRWCPPDFLPKDGKGVLFLDELPQAPQMVQSALLELSLDRKIGAYRLPDHWRVVAAGNRQDDRAGANRLITPLLNRFLHLDVGLDADEWVSWASQAQLAPEVTAYIKMRPDRLYGFDPTTNERAFPTPRSWSFVSDVCERFRGEAGGPVYRDEHAHLLLPAVGGCIGAGAAAEFVAHLKNAALLPDPRALLAAPTATPIPSDPSLVYAMVLGLAAVVRKEPGLLSSFAAVVRRVEAEYAYFALAQVTAGMATKEMAKIVVLPGYQEVIAHCRKGGVQMSGV